MPGKERQIVVNHDPLLRELNRIVGKQDMEKISVKAGLAASVLGFWLRDLRVPKLPNFNSVLNVLGYELKIVKMEKDQPDLFDGVETVNLLDKKHHKQPGIN